MLRPSSWIGKPPTIPRRTTVDQPVTVAGPDGTSEPGRLFAYAYDPNLTEGAEGTRKLRLPDYRLASDPRAGTP